MRRGIAILMTGLAAGLLAYCCLYYLGTARCRALAKSPEPELAWLEEEFHISDGEFVRIGQLHRSYLAGCAERCRQIDERNQQLKSLLAGTNSVTPEIAGMLTETAQLRAECQKQMLQHAYEISRTMPPEQGRRYLAWIQAQAISADTHSQMTRVESPKSEVGSPKH